MYFQVNSQEEDVSKNIVEERRFVLYFSCLNDDERVKI
jgi:hypothetical protein